MKICKVNNCNRKHYARGYCQKHWHRLQRHGTVKLIDWRKGKYIKCKICKTKIYRSPTLLKVNNFGYCKKCWVSGINTKGIKLTKEHKNKIRNAWLKKTGEKHPAWKGGVKRDNAGYTYIYMSSYPKSSRYIREHRLVMEKYLGRYLTKEEVVHHINGVRDDNRIENLLLCSSLSEHRKLHKPR